MDDVYFPWSDDYKVGIRLIDNNHRELFNTLNELHAMVESADGLGSRGLKQVIDRLGRYAREHFEREEHLMSEYGYPDVAGHSRKHADFVRVVYALRKIEGECPHRIDPARLVAFLEGWLKRHILNHDRDYIPYLKGDYGRRRSDRTLPLRGPESSDGPDKDELVDVTVQVPRGTLDNLRRCAALLRAGGDGAHALRTLTDPLSAMTLDEAFEFAKVVLRRD